MPTGIRSTRNLLRLNLDVNQTPKAFANFSPGLEQMRQPWEQNFKKLSNAESVIDVEQPSVFYFAIVY
jgi:hypothetical protein